MDAPQRGAGGGGEVATIELLDQMRHHLGVGLADELVTLGGELGAQLAKVLDDPVVDQMDASGAVLVGMGVDQGGPPMGGPPGMADAQVAGRLGPLLQAAGELGDLAFALDHRRGAGAMGVEDRHPGRVVAAVFEPPQAVDQDRRGGAGTGVADDAAHTRRTNGKGLAPVTGGPSGSGWAVPLESAPAKGWERLPRSARW